ncbi:hypothetical protein K443DRAFT_590563 [Laccaria amethystina LaAM-08-1]|uniref:Uncharacterized protein n=1 Tax=Laccaria amethystina LaAM-08-1 TaxID=1095629 RepID=A0A0C9YJK9_9AGAR|nr:hypothetical protein K443DRAFT_590563 [Laccaria amethystina LaAM-08-1]
MPHQTFTVTLNYDHSKKFALLLPPSSRTNGCTLCEAKNKFVSKFCHRSISKEGNRLKVTKTCRNAYTTSRSGRGRRTSCCPEVRTSYCPKICILSGNCIILQALNAYILHSVCPICILVLAFRLTRFTVAAEASLNVEEGSLLH